MYLVCGEIGVSDCAEAPIRRIDRALRRAIGPAYFIVGFFYVMLAVAPRLPVAALCVLLAHCGGAILWVFSTVLLQLAVRDEYRGRVFAAESSLFTLTIVRRP